MVAVREYSRILISTFEDSDTDSPDENYTIVKHDENWHELIEKTPYLFCE